MNIFTQCSFQETHSVPPWTLCVIYFHISTTDPSETSSCYNKRQQARWIKLQTFLYLSSGAWGVLDQGVGRFGSR